MIWTSEQARRVTDRVLSLSKADETFVTLTGNEKGNVRFARNTATTSGTTSGASVAVTAKVGMKSGSVTTAEFDEDSLLRAVRNAEEIARLSPENPESMPVLPPQQYSPSRAYFDDAAGATPEWRASAVGAAIELAVREKVVTAGFVETVSAMHAVASSKGLFAFDRYTSADYNLTARTEDASGSGWAARSFNERRLLDPRRLAASAIDKAVRSRNPVALEPGTYPVVLEPPAVADLLAYFLFVADARPADEGRSFFSRKGGGNRVGERLLGENVHIYSDPAHPLAPTLSSDGEGLPIKRTEWVEKGVLQDLYYSRFWAQKQGKPAMASPLNAIMDGGTSTPEQLIEGVERGLLVTRFWYIRSLDPQTILLTGLTRDGLFLIEKGKVTRAVRNMRWNESPVVALNGVEAMSPAERVVSGEGIGGQGFAIVCPGARIREFTFSSPSDAI